MIIIITKIITIIIITITITITTTTTTTTITAITEPNYINRNRMKTIFWRLHHA